MEPRKGQRGLGRADHRHHFKTPLLGKISKYYIFIVTIFRSISEYEEENKLVIHRFLLEFRFHNV